MRGGAFFNGKEGRVDFRKNLRLRKDWWVFEVLLRFKRGLVGFRKKHLVQPALSKKKK